jgi:hypothetical protein
MTSILRRKYSSKEIGRCFMTLDIGILKEKFVKGGWSIRDRDNLRQWSSQTYNIDDALTPLLTNGHRLKLYHRPTSRDSFIKHIVVKSDFEIICVGDSSLAPIKKR